MIPICIIFGRLLHYYSLWVQLELEEEPHVPPLHEYGEMVANPEAVMELQVCRSSISYL